MRARDVEGEIRIFLADRFLLGRAEALRNDAVLLGNVIDSTGTIELITFLQDHFGVMIEDEEVAMPENFDSLKNVVAFVERKLHSKS
jgi:acyl carrier protein